MQLKDIFPTEAGDFTPWLANHEEIIEKITGKDCRLYGREVPLLRYYADLLFHYGNRQLIVVENQFGESDHDHFGKCLMYTFLTNANLTIWVAESFSQEYHNILHKVNINLVLCEVKVAQDSTGRLYLKLNVTSKRGCKYLTYDLVDGVFV